jgi:membrane fusion protein, heavy metal efflux system
MERRSFSFNRWAVAVTVVLVLGAIAWFSRGVWLPVVQQLVSGSGAGGEAAEPPAASPAAAKILELSTQARQNLDLRSQPVKKEDYWRTILVPGEIVDRPGVSDIGVTAPAVGVVSEVHALPGDIVRPGDRLFTLRLVSEYIQNSQAELYKAARESDLVRERRDRLNSAVQEGAIPQSRLVELDQELSRLEASMQALQQDLLSRGLRLEQLDAVRSGSFVQSIEVAVPVGEPPATGPFISTASPGQQGEFAYEFQDLKAELGAQVQAGELLATLANHQHLYIAGDAFKREAGYLERAAQGRWPIEVEFADDQPDAWPPLDQTFAIRHLANSIDPASRTFEFFVPLTNQSRSYEENGERFVVWRFRPGQRVRLHVPVEKMEGVIVLPAGAVVREGPEAFVFRQNGDLFERLPVRVLHEDRLKIVLANDGSVAPDWYIAQGSAATLNRVLKAQAASGVEPGVHVHADGTVHGAH